MSEEIETYSPPTDEQVPLPVDADTTGFEDVLDQQGMIATKLNEKVIIQRIAKDLYKNASSGMRELYNNSARACRIAVKKHDLKNPLIRITMNAETRQLIIEDNGIGISKERFKKVLIELGTSDNLQAGEVGQFGMGFASYTTLSSVILIDTRARNGDSYKMLAKDGMSFQPVGEAEIEGFGTRMTMTCYESVNFNDLIDKLEGIAKYSGVPTILELNEFDYIPRYYCHGANAFQQKSFKEDVLSAKTEHDDVIDIETDDFHLIALVGVGISANYNHVHLLNVPIESEIKTPFRWWMLNIKDERRFKPMPDRDRMTETADRILEGQIDKAVKNYFSDLDITSYKEFIASNRANEFLWLTTHRDWASTKMLPTLVGLADIWVRDVAYDTKYFHDTHLIDKMSDNHNIVYQGYKNKGVTDHVKELMPQVKLITVKKSKKNDWKKHVAFMEHFGIPTARQILIDNKITVPKQTKSEMEIIGHFNEKYYDHDMIDLDDIDENVIRCDTVPILDVVRYVKRFPSPYTFVRNAEELDEYDSRDFSEWIKEIPNIMVATNKGIKSIKELADTKEEVIFCTDYDDEFSYFFKEEKRTVVYGTTGLLPLAIHLNPKCEVSGSFNDPVVPVTDWEFHKFVNEKYDIHLNSDEDKKFFCNNMHKISPCFHTLFAKLLNGTPYTTKDSGRENLWNGYLETILKYKPFNMEDEIEKLLFYYGESAKIVKKDSLLGDSLEYLLNRTQSAIMSNELLKTRLVKEVLMPKIFGHIEFRSMKKQELSYGECYDVSLATHDTEFSFRDDMVVYGFELMFRGFKMKINKGYCSITLTVYISR